MILRFYEFGKGRLSKLTCTLFTNKLVEPVWADCWKQFEKFFFNKKRQPSFLGVMIISSTGKARGPSGERCGELWTIACGRLESAQCSH